MIKQMLLSLSFFTFNSYCCQIEQPTRIESWEHAAEFAGKLIVFKSKTTFIQNKESFPSTNGPLLEGFGYIEKNSQRLSNNQQGQELGYRMRRLVKPAAVETSCFLINSLLKNADLFIRPATPSEATTVQSKLKSGTALFTDTASIAAAFTLLNAKYPKARR